MRKIPRSWWRDDGSVLYYIVASTLHALLFSLVCQEIFGPEWFKNPQVGNLSMAWAALLVLAYIYDGL